MSLLELFCHVDDFWLVFAPAWKQTLLAPRADQAPAKPPTCGERNHDDAELDKDTARCSPYGLYVSASSPPNPACQFPGTVALRHSLSGFCLRTALFVSIDVFCSVFLGMTRQAQRFEHFQSVIRHIPPSLSRSVLVMHGQLSRLTAPFAGSLQLV
jgi:hypothetical protein